MSATNEQILSGQMSEANSRQREVDGQLAGVEAALTELQIRVANLEAWAQSEGRDVPDTGRHAR